MKGQIEQDTAAEVINLEVEELENRTAPVTFNYGSLQVTYTPQHHD
jgi:hypothetical protein